MRLGMTLFAFSTQCTVSAVYFYNYGWLDYGVPTLESVLDMVKVVDFALRGGKVAVHCHAGLGRTGVLIACYLVYSERMAGDEAISHVRVQRCVPVARGADGAQPSLCTLSFSSTHAIMHTCTFPGRAQSRRALRLKLSSSLSCFSVPFGTFTLPRHASPPQPPLPSRSTCRTSLSCYMEQSRQTSNTFQR